MEKNIYNIDKNAHYFVLMHPLEKQLYITEIKEEK